MLRTAAVESSANLRVPGNGGRALRHHLLRSRASPRARLAAGSRRADWENSGADRIGAINLVRRMAHVNDRLVSDERRDLVDSVRALSLRRVARVCKHTT